MGTTIWDWRGKMDFEASLLKKRILIVDDDYSLNTSIKEVLKNAGFQTY